MRAPNSPQVAFAALAGGWAASWGHCDDRAIVERSADRVIALVADATSPTYPGYHTPLGTDRGIAAIQRSLDAHEHECGRLCLVAAFESAQRTMHELTTSARAGRRVAERFELGDSLIHTAASITGALLVGGQVHLAQVGSCRAYRRRGSGIEVLLPDHTYNTQRVAEGLEPQPEHNTVVIRLLGFMADTRPDFGTFELEPGDRLLLCSDGIWLHDAPLIAEALAAPSAPAIVEAITMGLARPLRDDVAVVAIAV